MQWNRNPERARQGASAVELICPEILYAIRPARSEATSPLKGCMVEEYMPVG